MHDGLSADKTRLLFEHVRLYTFGVGALCAAQAYRFSDEDLRRIADNRISGDDDADKNRKGIRAA